MEHHDLTDDLDRRLRAARPAAARIDEHAFDAALLDRLRREPIAARRAVPRSLALPVVAGVTIVATAAVVLGGGPGNVGGPPSAEAITQTTLRWLTPPAGTILHVRSVETTGTQTVTREYWQSADHPAAARELVEGTRTFETSGGAIYDPATDTIYDAAKPPATAGDPTDDKAKRDPATADQAKARPAKAANADQPAPDKPAEAKVATADQPGIGKPGDESTLVADPIVRKVRTLLQEGDMTVIGRQLHNGTDTWAISLKPDFGRPVWTLWVSVADGKPVELRDPGQNPGDQPQVVRWSTYEVLPGDAAAQQLLTLTGAHPTAQVVHDPAQAAAADARLLQTTP